MKKLTLNTIACAIIILSASNSFGQMESSRKYRVIAYKKGNTTVTSTSNEAAVTPPMYVYIPNSFTPNGDNINDTFGISGEAVKSFSMQIFNRWGDMVFESNDANTQWNGNYNGAKASQGVYVYKVWASSHTNKKIQKEGTVTLVQ